MQGHDNEDVVRKIAAEVLRRLGAEAEPQAAAPPAAEMSGARGKRALILLTGGDRRLDEALVQVGRIAEQAEASTVLMSPSAERIVTVPAVRRAAPEARVLLQGEVDAILEGVDAIYLPNMSLTAASKIGGLMPDSLVCITAIQGLIRGIPLVASVDSLLPAAADPARVPPGVMARLEQILGELKGMGVQLVGAAGLLSARSGAPAPGHAAVKLSPSITPRPTPLTPTPTPGKSCSDASGESCSACGLCAQSKARAVRAIVDHGASRVGAALGTKPASGDLAGLIDHTLLKADATEEQIRKLCAEAAEHHFASVCVNPGWVGLCAELLAGTDVAVCTVIGFPLGATTPTAKAIETRDAIANGASEVDMVINVGGLKSGNDELVRKDIEAVVQAARGRAITKVIIETALLSREEKIKACLLAKMAGADFVKTSTGFGPGGATVEDIALMRETVGAEMGVKASGGIGDQSKASAMVAAGATRIGASASVAIVTGGKSAGGY